MRVLVLVTLLLVPSLAHAAVDREAAGLVTELVTNALAKEPRFDVLSSGDVRRALEIEANKQALGCDTDATSCLAEIAGALGAQLVVYGKLGTLDDVVVLTLNLFESSSTRAAGRVALREKSLASLSDKVDAAVHELVSPYASQLAPGQRTKLLVLDIEAPGGGAAADGAPATAPPTAEPLSALFLGGVGALIGGVVVAATGVVLYLAGADAYAVAENRDTDASTAVAKYGESDIYGGLSVASFVVAGAAVVGGAALVVAGME